MIRVVLTGLLLLQVGLINCVLAQDKSSGFKRGDFFSVMESGNEASLNNELEMVKTASFANRGAFEGALLMKKASVVGGAKKKFDLFKAGHKKLEAVLKKDSSDVETRFLRLMIQEHAPRIMGYKSELASDRLYILKNFGKLSPAVQQAIKDYSKQSDILKPTDF